MIHKIILWFFGIFWFFHTVLAEVNIENDILPSSSVFGAPSTSWSTTDTSMLDNLFAYVRNSLFSLLMLIAIAVFVYIGFKLITARGNPEEFKKALNTFIYAVVGIFIVSFAFAAVRLVAGLNL